MSSGKLSVPGRFLASVKQYDLLPEGSNVLVAVSGGADSVCLLDLLRLVQARLKLRLAAFHLNHGLRETAARDESFVRTLCRDWGVELVVARADVAGYAKRHKLGIEEAGRELRYRHMERVARKLACDVIALGHTANDNLETMLLNLVRGAGPRGLAGIPVRRSLEPDYQKTEVPSRGPRHSEESDDEESRLSPVSGGIPHSVRNDRKAQRARTKITFVRPLIDIERGQIEHHLRARGIAWVEDESNADPKYRRNLLRREVVPVLARLSEAAVANARRAAQLLAEEGGFLDGLAEAAARDVAVLSPGRPETGMDATKARKTRNGRDEPPMNTDNRADVSGKAICVGRCGPCPTVHQCPSVVSRSRHPPWPLRPLSDSACLRGSSHRDPVGRVRIDILKFRDYNNILKRRILKLVLPELDSQAVEGVLEFCNRDTGGRLSLTRGVRAHRHRGVIEFERSKEILDNGGQAPT